MILPINGKPYSPEWIVALDGNAKLILAVDLDAPRAGETRQNQLKGYYFAMEGLAISFFE
jgi:hypothetical protein